MVPPVGVEPEPELERTIAEAVGADLGHPFRPKRQLFVSDLPKIRNTKILRRVVKAVVTGGEPGDLAALLNPQGAHGARVSRRRLTRGSACRAVACTRAVVMLVVLKRCDPAEEGGGGQFVALRARVSMDSVRRTGS